METIAKMSNEVKTDSNNIAVERCLTTILLNLEIPTKTMGYFYSRECAKIIYNNPIARFQMNELVFKVISEKYNTTPSKIERSIRHLLSSPTIRKSIRKLNGILNVPVNFNIIHPSVCEFLCLLAECVNFVK